MLKVVGVGVAVPITRRLTSWCFHPCRETKFLQEKPFRGLEHEKSTSFDKLVPSLQSSKSFL